MATQKAIHVTYERVLDGWIFDGLEHGGYFAVRDYDATKEVMKINAAGGFWPFECLLRSPEKQQEVWIFEVLFKNDLRWWNGE